MMKRSRKLMADLMMMLLVVVLCAAAGRSQERSVKQRPGQPKPKIVSASHPSTAIPTGMSLEETLIRDVYARLMRYQSAGLDESRERAGKSIGPQDYLTFELRGLHSGPISELQSRPLSEVVTQRGGEALNIRPAYLRVKNDPAFAFYEAEWATLPEAKNEPGATTEMPSFALFNRYTSYTVTVRLNGKQRQYRAIAVYQLNAEDPKAGRPKAIQILDNVTAEMNTVYAEESPRVRIPWSQFVKSGQYQQIVRTIKEKKEAGQPLAESNQPIMGDLPGDGGGGDPPNPDPDPTTCAAPKISGETNVWWFNGQNPSGYATSITLTASPATGSSYSWSVVAGNDKVVLSNFIDNTVRVTGLKASTFHEVGIRVTVDGVNSPTFSLSVRAPHRLVLTKDFEHLANTAGLWYDTNIYYRIEDQFTDVLPSNVGINEHFTAAAVADFAGHDWTGANNLVNGGALINPTEWRDHITGPNNNPVNPPALHPCTPNLCNTKVYHWPGEWFVGSTTIGSGRRVQTNTWQRLTDHAEHNDRVSPAP